MRIIKESLTIMKQRAVLFFLFCVVTLTLSAQRITVHGVVLDGDTNETLPSATVQLLKTDSTQAAGVATNTEGVFKLPAVRAGNYILKVSFVGFVSHIQNLTLTKEKKTIDMGQITLRSNAVLLKGAEVTAHAAQVVMKEDTFVYNSAAYRLPEGSALEELVKKLPGAEVDDDGKIKINGKEVKKIMVDGKEFFNNDTKMAMKNLPTKMIERIKAYDRQSDYTRITGIDDGEEETVLDLSVKKEMKQGWVVNTDVGYGTEDRYTGKANVNRFADNYQFTVIGSANNVNDRGWGGGGNGLVASKMAGLNFSWENGKKDREAGFLKLGGNVRYSHSSSDSESKTNSETFLSGGSSSSFSNSRSKSFNHNTNVNGNFRVEWAPDSMTNIMFRPNFSYSESYGNSGSSSVTFNSDPYAKYTDPLYQYTDDDESLVNSNERESKNDGSSKSVDGRLQLNRRLNSKGRNITLNFSGGYSTNENESFSISKVRFYQETDPKKMRSYTNQYNLNPSESYNYQGRLSYSEPLFAGATLQASYSLQYRYSDSDRSMYSLDSLVSKGYITEEELYLGYVPTSDWLELCKNVVNSQYATYKEYNHNANIMFRYNKDGLRVNAGVSFQPQTTHMDYAKNKLDTTVTRHVFNWAPRVDVRYKISNTSQFRFRYNGHSGQPSMTNLLDVTDSSDPLNVSRGNPELKPSWTNRMNLFYNNYIPELQRGWMVHANASMTENSISTAVIYDESTGKRTTKPMNINGNWNANGAFMFNTALGEKKYFNIHTFTHWGYNNAVGYISARTTDAMASGQPTKSTTKSTNLGERLNFNFRNDLMELGVNGNINYQHARNALQKSANMDTYNFSYGGNVVFNFPWNMSLASDLSQNCRRGYDDESMNTDELIWNAQLSQIFMKNKAATLSVQWFDILRQRSNISRSLSATTRTDRWSNAINSYVMVHFIYKLNLFGSREARSNMGGPDAGRGAGPRGPRGGGSGGGGRPF